MVKKLWFLLFLSMIILTNLRIWAQQEVLRYGGVVAVVGEGPELVSRAYRVRPLAILHSNGTSPLIAQNDTFNKVSFNGTHVRLLLERNSSIITVGDLNLSLLPPLLVSSSGGTIEEVSLLEGACMGDLEITEAKKEGIARIHLNNESLQGYWSASIGGWIFRRDWNLEGELSYIALFDNGTCLAFRGISKPHEDLAVLGNVTGSYDRIEISAENGSVIVRAYGPPIKPARSSSIELRSGLLLYEGEVKALLEIEELSGVPYRIIEPSSCSTCEFSGIKYYFDPDLRLDVEAEVPSVVLGGTTFQVMLAPPDRSREVTLIFGTTSVMLEGMNVPVRIEVNAPTVEVERTIKLLISVRTEHELFGWERGVKILPAYGVSLVNTTRVYLLGGRGTLHVRVSNSGDLPARVSSLIVQLSDGGSPIRLSFPMYEQIPPRSSIVLPVPLSIPMGEYAGKLSLNITDYSNKNYTINLPDSIMMYSVPEAPINIMTFISPEDPNLGDEVRLSISFSSMVPLKGVLINVSSSGMDPISDTSKLLADISEWETVKLDFSFRAKTVGPSSIMISLHYLPEGYGSYRTVFRELPIFIGEVSGRVYAETRRARVMVNESVEVSIRVETPKGEVTLEFPREASVVESQGMLVGNRLKVTAPSQFKVVLRFNASGNFTIPSLALFNDSRILRVDAVHIYVVSEATREKEREIRSKLADLSRRYRTLLETLRGSPQYEEALSMVEEFLKEGEALINEGRISAAEESLKRAEDIILGLEERTYTQMGAILNFLIYFIIGAGLSLLLLILRRAKRGSRIWK